MLPTVYHVFASIDIISISFIMYFHLEITFSEQNQNYLKAASRYQRVLLWSIFEFQLFSIHLTINSLFKIQI